jgi:hypothetical protein
MKTEHANWFETLLWFVVSAIIVLAILTARRGRALYIRPIPGLAAIDEAVGRATEMGRPMLFTFGLAGIDIVSMQALAVLSHIARIAARLGNRLIVPLADVPLYTLTEEVMREAWAAEGKQDAFRSDDIRFLSDQQFAYAAGVIGLLNREQVASAFYFGYFYAESLLLAESGQQVGAIQVAGTPATTQIPFFIVASDYTIIGDEYYAASAYLSREPTLLGSLVGQDIGKGILIFLIVLGTIFALLHGFFPRALPHNWLADLLGGAS